MLDFYGFHAGEYTKYMDPMGIEPLCGIEPLFLTGDFGGV